jgi:broad specificity phosphatase PhoE
MKQLYFVRHGNAVYREDSLSRLGRNQVERLSQRLDEHLPESLDCVFASSPSGRAVQTAEILLPMIERKCGKQVYIESEPALDQTRSMWGAETVLRNGEENVALLDKYSRSECGIFVAHDNIIVATSVAIAKYEGIEVPAFIRVDEIDQSLVSWAMGEFGYTRERAEEKVREYGMKPIPEIKPIDEASAIHIDLEEKGIEYIQIDPPGRAEREFGGD